MHMGNIQDVNRKPWLNGFSLTSMLQCPYILDIEFLYENVVIMRSSRLWTPCSNRRSHPFRWDPRCDTGGHAMRPNRTLSLLCPLDPKTHCRGIVQDTQSPVNRALRQNKGCFGQYSTLFTGRIFNYLLSMLLTVYICFSFFVFCAGRSIRARYGNSIDNSLGEEREEL